MRELGENKNIIRKKYIIVFSENIRKFAKYLLFKSSKIKKYRYKNQRNINNGN